MTDLDDFGASAPTLSEGRDGSEGAPAGGPEPAPVPADPEPGHGAGNSSIRALLPASVRAAIEAEEARGVSLEEQAARSTIECGLCGHRFLPDGPDELICPLCELRRSGEPEEAPPPDDGIPFAEPEGEVVPLFAVREDPQTGDVHIGS